MMLNAITTNVISNALHAFLSFLYFIGAVIHYLKKDSAFNLPFVLFFFSLFVLKILGAYAHYYDPTGILDNIWIAIAFFVIILNYSMTEAIRMPLPMKICLVILSIISSFFFLTVFHNINHIQFLFIAFPLVIVYFIAAYYAKAMLKVGFIMIVVSNIFWLVTRQIENYVLGHEILPKFTYDNDIFHILLIISSYITYKAISKNKCN